MVMSLDFSRCRLAPFAHQREDTQAMIDHPWFFIASEMRTGKSAIVVMAAQFLFEADIIDHVIVVSPAPVRAVWCDRDLGEIAKHAWPDLPMTVMEFHAQVRSWVHGANGRRLEWLITNFEFLRSGSRLDELLPSCGPRTLLVLDESAFVKNYKAEQTRACMALRKACGRVVLLNGTPIFHSPLDLFSQGNLLHPSILECKSVTHFKARYAIQRPVLGYGGRAILDKWGRGIQAIAGWQHLDDLQRRFAPYTVRRLQKDCLDLPPKLDAVTLTATFTPATWKIYRAMRDELVAWLENGNVASSPTAAIKTLRLAQITSGFLGGVEDEATLLGGRVEDGLLESLDLGGDNDEQRIQAAQRKAGADHGVAEENPLRAGVQQQPSMGVRAIGHEKLDVLLWFLGQRLEEDEHFKTVLWCKFRPELFRLLAAINEKYPQMQALPLCGGQKKAERVAAMALLNPASAPAGPAALGVTFGTGGFGVNFTAARCSINVSQDFSPGKARQSGDRIYGPGMIGPAAYFDIVAVGPKGQKTIDHHVIAARRAGENVADWTAAAWVKALTEE